MLCGSFSLLLKVVISVEKKEKKFLGLRVFVNNKPLEGFKLYIKRKGDD